jgi:hypothetical protein
VVQKQIKGQAQASQPRSINVAKLKHAVANVPWVGDGKSAGSIAPHNKQFPGHNPKNLRAPGKESHHVESQSRLGRTVANYDAQRINTILLEKKTHTAVTKLQKVLMSQPGHDKGLGTTKSTLQHRNILVRAGVNVKVANRAALTHQGDLFNTTPLTPETPKIGPPVPPELAAERSRALILERTTTGYQKNLTQVLDHGFDKLNKSNARTNAQVQKAVALAQKGTAPKTAAKAVATAGKSIGERWNTLKEGTANSARLIGVNTRIAKLGGAAGDKLQQIQQQNGAQLRPLAQAHRQANQAMGIVDRMQKMGTPAPAVAAAIQLAHQQMAVLEAQQRQITGANRSPAAPAPAAPARGPVGAVIQKIGQGIAHATSSMGRGRGPAAAPSGSKSGGQAGGRGAAPSQSQGIAGIVRGVLGRSGAAGRGASAGGSAAPKSGGGASTAPKTGGGTAGTPAPPPTTPSVTPQGHNPIGGSMGGM